jgi:hypothetical protein
MLAVAREAPMKPWVFAITLLSAIFATTAHGETADEVAELRRQRDAASTLGAELHRLCAGCGGRSTGE